MQRHCSVNVAANKLATPCEVCTNWGAVHLRDDIPVTDAAAPEGSALNMLSRHDDTVLLLRRLLLDQGFPEALVQIAELWRLRRTNHLQFPAAIMVARRCMPTKLGELLLNRPACGECCRLPRVQD